MTAINFFAGRQKEDAGRRTVGWRFVLWALTLTLAILAPLGAGVAGLGFDGGGEALVYYMGVFMFGASVLAMVRRNSPAKAAQAATKDLETIRIGIFDRLIIYAPLFAANGLGYFEDEGLTVEFDTGYGDDKALAEAVRTREILFAACDPFVCLPEEEANWDKQVQEEDLLILLPLVKRLGITVFGRNRVENRFRGKDDINIISYEKGSTTYQTAELFRRWLLANLDEAFKSEFDIENRLKVVGLSVAPAPFATPEALVKNINQASFVLLWEPQTSWMFADVGMPFASVFRDFGIVAVPSGADPRTGSDHLPFSIFPTCRPRGPRGYLGEAMRWRTWTPSPDEDMFRYLVTGLVTSRHVLQNHPELCRRMFRAISRACLRLHGVRWTFDATDKLGVFEQVLLHINTRNVDQKALHALVDPDGVAVPPSASTGDYSVFPFLQSLKMYKPDNYLPHLSRSHDLWSEGKSKDPISYRRFFAQPADLNLGA